MARPIDPELQKRQQERTKRREQERAQREARRERERLEQERKEEMRRLAKGPVDMPFFLLVLTLNAVGLVMLFSASFPSAYYEALASGVGSPFTYVAKQAAFFLFGLVAMCIIGRYNYQSYRKFAEPLMTVSLALLVLVLIPGVGVTRNNATRWLAIPGLGVDFQPSELAKLAVVLYFANSISKKKEKMKSILHGVLVYAGWLLVFGGLLMAQPHLSGAILVMGTGGLMMFVGGIHWLWLAVAGGGAWAAYYVIIEVVGYNASRIEMWKDPWLDPLDKGYQMVQSLLAIGSGGLLGLGLGKSRQKFLYLPEEHNDFIFAVICEELGLIGATIIMILFAALILRGYWIALHARDRFGSLLVVGVITLIAMQVFLNIAVVTGLIPATGISLPFFSYGGTALLVQMASMGFVLSVSRQMKLTKPG